MATLILGPGGTPQGVIPYIKRNAALLGISDQFMYFAFDVDRAIETHDGLLPEERLWLRMADREDLRQRSQQWHLDPELLEYVHEKGTRGVRAIGAFFASFNWQELRRQIRMRMDLLMARGEREGQRIVVVLFSTEGGTGSSLALYTLAILRDLAQHDRKRFQTHLIPVCPLIYNPHDDASLVARRKASGYRALAEIFQLQEPGAPLALNGITIPRQRDLCWLVEPDLPESRLEKDRLFPFLARFIVEISEGPVGPLFHARFSNIEAVE